MHWVTGQVVSSGWMKGIAVRWPSKWVCRMAVLHRASPWKWARWRQWDWRRKPPKGYTDYPVL
ncbi:MAG TPA: hypothetical protein VGN00_29565 [Puia sp.]